jgi:hypothetical protein
MTDLLLGKSVQAHLYICRIPLDQVPVEEQACAQWLYELYQKKVTMPHITYKVETLSTYFCMAGFVFHAYYKVLVT